tara:strand:+ start:1350 stop:2381 length:1032 start_codon:yes stop_codon:yes gene_type:complete
LNLRTEESIVSRWKHVDETYVSIICMTFNQESYIENTIKGFLIQETDFKFEIIIHDDASTDRTPKIIKAYAEKYPSLIKVIQQSENQYSKKPTLPTHTAINATNGKYIAICEGDDYWSSENKIRQQIELLEKNPETDLCYHDCEHLSGGSIITSPKKISKNLECHSYVSFESIVKGGGAFICTPSIVMRSSSVKNLPDFFLNSPVGDYVLQVLSASSNGAIKLNKPMAVYRVASQGSWSSEQANYNKERNTRTLTAMIETISALDNYLANTHSNAFDIAIAKEYVVFAFKALKAKDIEEFKRLMGSSYKHKRLASAKQTIMHMGTIAPYLFYHIYRLYQQRIS